MKDFRSRLYWQHLEKLSAVYFFLFLAGLFSYFAWLIDHSIFSPLVFLGFYAAALLWFVVVWWVIKGR